VCKIQNFETDATPPELISEEGEIDVQKKGQICKLKKGRIKLTNESSPVRALRSLTGHRLWCTNYGLAYFITVDAGFCHLYNLIS
jgi:hypothetical protein